MLDSMGSRVYYYRVGDVTLMKSRNVSKNFYCYVPFRQQICPSYLDLNNTVTRWGYGYGIHEHFCPYKVTLTLFFSLGLKVEIQNDCEEKKRGPILCSNFCCWGTNAWGWRPHLHVIKCCCFICCVVIKHEVILKQWPSSKYKPPTPAVIICW